MFKTVFQLQAKHFYIRKVFLTTTQIRSALNHIEFGFTVKRPELN